MPDAEDPTAQRATASGPRISTSKRDRGGARFQPVQERRLISEARTVLADLERADGLLALTEFNSPFGVPDVTAVVGGSSARTRRLRSQVPALLNEIDAGIVSAASPTIPRSPAQLAYYLRWPTASVERRLPSLLSSGALTQSRSGLLSHPAIVSWGELVAIELKVRDWRRALKQCRRYRLWANSYVLVVTQVPDAAVGELKRAVGVDRGGLVVDGELLLHPRQSPHKRSRALWATEHVVAELQARR